MPRDYFNNPRMFSQNRPRQAPQAQPLGGVTNQAPGMPPAMQQMYQQALQQGAGSLGAGKPQGLPPQVQQMLGQPQRGFGPGVDNFAPQGMVPQQSAMTKGMLGGMPSQSGLKGALLGGMGPVPAGMGDMSQMGGPRLTPEEMAMRMQGGVGQPAPMGQQLNPQQAMMTPDRQKMQELTQQMQTYQQSNPAFQQMQQLQSSFGPNNMPNQQQIEQMQQLMQQVNQDPRMMEFQAQADALKQQQMNALGQPQVMPAQLGASLGSGLAGMTPQQRMAFGLGQAPQGMPQPAPSQPPQAVTGNYANMMQQAQGLQNMTNVKPMSAPVPQQQTAQQTQTQPAGISSLGNKPQGGGGLF